MKNLLLLPFLMLLTSCNSDKDENLVNDFRGYYKITSIISETPIDLNNDGLKSTNLLEEITSPHTTLNGVFPNFYNPENGNNFAEVRPLVGQSNSTQFIAFNFPEQSISYLNNDLEMNIPILMHYSTSMNAGIVYEFINQNEIRIIDNNPEWNSQFGAIKSLIRIDKNNFEIDLDKKMFDFSSKQWMDLKVKAQYKKVGLSNATSL
jgi:hypothetical protein